jgi:hypothetical protein
VAEQFNLTSRNAKLLPTAVPTPRSANASSLLTDPPGFMHVPSSVTLLPGRILLLGLYQPVQDLDEIVTLEAGSLGGVKRSLQPVFHLAQ